jgi:hypothetical protein
MPSFIVKVSANFDCSVERAFKTPLLCDVSKVHTGFGIMPPVTHCSDDANWGQIGSTKKVYVAPSLTQKGGYASMDKILEREENTYWRFEVYDFQSWMLNFYKFSAEWRTTALAENSTRIDYTYTLHANSWWFFPLNYLFAKLFWKSYMVQVVERVRVLTNSGSPYLYL